MDKQFVMSQTEYRKSIVRVTPSHGNGFSCSTIVDAYSQHWGWPLSGERDTFVGDEKS